MDMPTILVIAMILFKFLLSDFKIQLAPIKLSSVIKLIIRSNTNSISSSTIHFLIVIEFNLVFESGLEHASVVVAVFFRTTSHTSSAITNFAFFIGHGNGATMYVLMVAFILIISQAPIHYRTCVQMLA